MINKGYTVNYLSVIDENFKKENNKKTYLCKCKCGNVKYINESSLKTKRIRDCGCGLYMIEKHNGEKHNFFVIESCYRKRINGKINIVAHCKCICGNYRDIPVSNIKNRISCGCQKTKKEKKPKKKYKIDRIKSIYKKMIDRCYNKNAKDYKWYGLKGITVCEEWINDFYSFKNWAFKNGYREKLSIDRINVNGNYEPNNCRWVDMITQQNNKKNNKRFLHKGEMLTLPQIARMENFNYHTLCSRIKSGLNVEESLSKPILRR